MDKRYKPMKDFGRVNKKPKLEIIFNKGRHIPTTSTHAESSRSAVRFRSPPKSSPDDLWDDDDDEVILLASQVVEKEIPRGQTVSSTIHTMDFTFSEFAPNAKVTSTQKPPVKDLELFSDLLDDDWGIDNIPEEPVFKAPAIVPVGKPNRETERITSEKTFSDGLFSDVAKTATPALAQATGTGESQNVYSAPLHSLTQPTANNKLSNRERSHECQIQFLQKRVDTLKKENAKSSKELDEFKNKIESKDGEVSLLRDEIRHLKQQFQSVQREKLQCTETAKNEWQDKINELAKQVEAQQTVLEFKTMEISKLKMNHAEETTRFERSMRENGNESLLHHQNIKVTSPNRRRLTQLQGLTRLNARIPTALSIPIEIFDHSKEKGNFKHRKDVFQREMERLQFQMSRLQYISQLKGDKKSDLVKTVVDSAKSVIAEFWTYVHSLEYNKHCQSLPYHSHDRTITDNRPETEHWNLFQAGELFSSEKAVNLRRYVAGMSIICQMVPEAGAMLFTVHHNEYLLLQIIVDALNKLGYSHEICQHFGVLESFALLLSTLWANHITEEACQENLISFLKTLVFCRPNSWASKYVTQCLLNMPTAVMGQLCYNSRAQTFAMTQSVYKFTPDSCFLQVYAGLLEIVFPGHHDLSASQFRLLLEICYNHLKFSTICFADPPPFIDDILPYDDDLEEDGGLSQRPGVKITCQCYVMMCSSVVKLLYKVLHQWQRMERKQETKLIENLSKVGIRLIHTIFIRYYMTKLFDHKGNLTRHCLYFVCKYWLESMDELRFTENQREALDQLASSHIIGINSPPQERDNYKVKRDLARWYTHSGDSKGEEVELMDVDGHSNGYIQFEVLEKNCNTDSFFQRY